MNQQIVYQPQTKSISDCINKKPKLVMALQVFQEEEFIELNLKNHFDHFDRILIIEGSIGKREGADEFGHSTDKSVQLIEDFKAKHDTGTTKKIVFLKIKRPWASLEDMKNTFLDLTYPGDILCVVDADEFYRPEDINRIRIAADRYPHMISFQSTMVHLYRDFYHAITPGAEWSPQPERIVRIIPNMRYLSHPVVSDSIGHSLYFSPEYIPRRASINNLFIWHYGYSRNNMKQVMERKLQYYQGELAKHGDAVQKFKDKYEQFLAGTEPEGSILGVDFDSQPSIMKEHSMYSYQDPLYKDKCYLNWKEHEFYKKVISGKPHELIYNCMRRLSTPHMNFYSNVVTIE